MRAPCSPQRTRTSAGSSAAPSFDEEPAAPLAADEESPTEEPAVPAAAISVETTSLPSCRMRSRRSSSMRSRMASFSFALLSFSSCMATARASRSASSKALGCCSRG